jgi:hypothetical protein
LYRLWWFEVLASSLSSSLGFIFGRMNREADREETKIVVLCSAKLLFEGF